MTQKMYLGPTVPGVVKKNEIFKDELPKTIEKKAKEDKDFARLLVGMDKVMEARQKMQAEGSVLSVAYANVEKSLMP